MLLAEDLLLLLTDDDSGKAVVDSTRLDLMLAGAVVLELAELGRVGVAGPGEQVRPGRLVVRDARPAGVPVLDEALDTLSRKKPDKPKNVLSAVAKGLRPALLAGLTDRGVLRAEQGKVLGLFPTRSWPAQDATHEQAVRRALHDVLVVGRAPTPRESAVVSLLQSGEADRGHRVGGGPVGGHHSSVPGSSVTGCGGYRAARTAARRCQHRRSWPPPG